MIASFALVMITIIEGYYVDEEPAFIFTECLINVLILCDFLARIKLSGFKKFIEGGCWNIFDCIVVTGCIGMFIIMLL
jgi:hypothetical protein